MFFRWIYRSRLGSDAYQSRSHVSSCSARCVLRLREDGVSFWFCPCGCGSRPRFLSFGLRPCSISDASILHICLFVVSIGSLGSMLDVATSCACSVILRHGGSNLWVRVRRTCVFLFVPLPFCSIASDVSIHVSSFSLLPRSSAHRSHTRIFDVVERTCPPPLVAAVPSVPSWTCFASTPFQWACFETGPSARSIHLFPRLDPTRRDAPRTWRWRTTSSSSSSSRRFRSGPEPNRSKKRRKNTIHQGIKK